MRHLTSGRHMDRVCETFLIINNSLEKQRKQRMQYICLGESKIIINIMSKCNKSVALDFKI